MSGLDPIPRAKSVGNLEVGMRGVLKSSLAGFHELSWRSLCGQ